MSFKWALLLGMLVRFNCFYVCKHQHFSGEKVLCWCHWEDFLFNNYSWDQMHVFSRCHWFYTTQGSCKYLISRVLALIKWAEWMSFPGDFTAGKLREPSTIPLGMGTKAGGWSGWGALKGAEHVHQRGEPHHLAGLCLPSFSPGVTAEGISWDPGFLLVTSSVLFILFTSWFYLPLPSKSLAR